MMAIQASRVHLLICIFSRNNSFIHMVYLDGYFQCLHHGRCLCLFGNKQMKIDPMLGLICVRFIRDSSRIGRRNTRFVFCKFCGINRWHICAESIHIVIIHLLTLPTSNHYHSIESEMLFRWSWVARVKVHGADTHETGDNIYNMIGITKKIQEHKCNFF